MAQESIRHWLLYEFQKGSTLEKAVENINGLLKDGEKIIVQTGHFWFNRFRQGNFSLKVDPM